jgi:hypothetical protein
MAKLFKSEINTFQWKDIKPFHVRNQYNELLNLVVNEYFTKQYPNNLPNFLNKNYCLTLVKFDDKCSCGNTVTSQSVISKSIVNVPSKEDIDLANALSELGIAERGLNFQWNTFEINYVPKSEDEIAKINTIKTAINQKKEVNKTYDEVITGIVGNDDFKKALSNQALKQAVTNFEGKYVNYKKLESVKRNAKNNAQLQLDAIKNAYEDALASYEIAQRTFDLSPTTENQAKQAATKLTFETAEANYKKRIEGFVNISNSDCKDKENIDFCLPNFNYERLKSLTKAPTDSTFNLSDLDFNTKELSVGTVIWLYFYERMGIFKILGALLDDYNYKGKYTISGSRADKNGNANTYSILMDMLGSLYREGNSSNSRDRFCTYERVLGVSIDNNLGIECQQNIGFMQTFNKLIDYMLEYYKTKQLAQAIQSQNGLTQPRSSVATQTSIRDTMNLLKQQFEPVEYGRNQINTFLGIATVHATLCLVNMLRKEIGIPDQYEDPKEFIPAAYQILVKKQPVTLNETNRFIVYDNCASYGYRLLTDIEKADLNVFSIIASGSTLDVWLNDIEGVVEGYNNAYKSISEPASAMV